MDYKQSGIVQRLASVEKQLFQQAVSARGGLLGIGWDFGVSQDELTADVADVWQDFFQPGPIVTVVTGTTALVFYSAQCLFDPAVLKYLGMAISYEISGATTRASGDIFSPTHIPREFQASIVSTAPNTYIPLMSMTVEEDLTPGENTFKMQGLYSGSLGSGSRNVAGRRGLVVIPLDV